MQVCGRNEATTSSSYDYIPTGLYSRALTSEAADMDGSMTGVRNPAFESDEEGSLPTGNSASYVLSGHPAATEDPYYRPANVNDPYDHPAGTTGPSDVDRFAKHDFDDQPGAFGSYDLASDYDRSIPPVDYENLDDSMAEAPRRLPRDGRRIMKSGPESDMKTDEMPDWNVADETVREVDRSCQRACVRWGEKTLKLIMGMVLALLTFGAAVTHTASIVFVAAQISSKDELYTCIRYETSVQPVYTYSKCLSANITSVRYALAQCLGADNVSDRSLATRAAPLCPAVTTRWVWSLFLMLATPELLVIVRCLFVWCTAADQVRHQPRSAEKRAEKRRREHAAYMTVLAIESAHAVGSSLFVFAVLPLLRSSVHSAALIAGVGAVPALLRLLGSSKIARLSTLIRVVDLLACIVQFSALVLWPVLILTGGINFSEDDIHLVWAIPLSLTLVSFQWFFNYVDDGTFSCKQRNESGTKGRSTLLTLKKDIMTLRTSAYLFASVWKVLLLFLSMVVYVSIEFGADHLFNFDLSRCRDAVGPDDIPKLEYDWLFVWAVNSSSLIVCYMCARTATKALLQIPSYALPLTLVGPFLMAFLLAICDVTVEDPCRLASFIPQYLTFDCAGSWIETFFENHAWIWIVWWLSQLWVSSHLWTPTNDKLVKSSKIFLAPCGTGLFLEQTLRYNRVRKDESEKGTNLLHGEDVGSFSSLRTSEDEVIPEVKICATMWHETSQEMESLMKSICSLDLDQFRRSIAIKQLHVKDRDFYNFEAHIFFDDAIESYDPLVHLEKGVPESAFDIAGKRINSYVKTFINVMNTAGKFYGSMDFEIGLPTPYQTPYGGRLMWTLPGGNKLIVHLKDKTLIRKKKRWSQVMYMYYFLGYEMNRILDSFRRQEKADNTYLLALDGDVDFEPRAVTLLLDRMRRDFDVAAACGRIHPVGQGLMVWYQKFEYAIGHWLQKSTEHVLGSVLCSPGCFSMFRASALMDANVMKTYTRKPTEAIHHVQYDQGEDRWLCTLLLQQGYHVDYCAAADAFTNAPTTFHEFFKQRRRWTPSTMANILDLLLSWRQTRQVNDYVTVGYIFYQGFLFGLSLLGTGSIFLMILGSLDAAFEQAGTLAWFLLNSAFIVGFVIVCFYTKEDTQLYVAMVLTTLYAIMQGIVLVAMVAVMDREGTCSASFIFFFYVLGIFVLAAIIHPLEWSCLLHGLLYFFLVPSMYMLLMIYAICNLNNISWGVREETQSDTAVQLQKTEEKAKSMKKKEEFARKTGIKGFFAVGDSDKDNGWAVQLGNCFRCICCPRSRSSEYEKILLEQGKLISEVSDLKVMLKDTANAETTEYRDEETLSGTEEPPEVTGTGTHSDEIRETQDDPAVDDPDVGVYRPENWMTDRRYTDFNYTESLPWQEDRFLNELIAEYLEPESPQTSDTEKLKADLDELRNRMAFSYLLLNAMFIVIVFAMKEFRVQIQWPCAKSPTLDPIGLVFLLMFGVILLIQALGMIAHRLQTLIQVISNTTLTTRDKDSQIVEEFLRETENVDLARRSDSTASLASSSGELGQPRRKMTVVANEARRRKKKKAKNASEVASTGEIYEEAVLTSFVRKFSAKPESARKKSMVFGRWQQTKHIRENHVISEAIPEVDEEAIEGAGEHDPMSNIYDVSDATTFATQNDLIFPDGTAPPDDIEAGDFKDSQTPRRLTPLPTKNVRTKKKKTRNVKFQNEAEQHTSIVTSEDTDRPANVTVVKPRRRKATPTEGSSRRDLPERSSPIEMHRLPSDLEEGNSAVPIVKSD